MNKLFKGLSLSLSANPRCLIKSTFSAATDVFASFLKNFSIEKSTRLHRSMVINGHRPANLDCRITSGNDNVERVIDHKKKTNITFKGLDVVRQYAALLERRVQSSTRVRKAQVVTRQTNPIGRSMIEMLGVLAIIGVLSVGGIAGYSKAMTQFKVNKIIAEANQLIADAHEYTLKDKSFSIGRLSSEEKKSLGLCPESWKNCEDSGLGRIWMEANRISFNPEVPEMCLATINNIAIPLKESVDTVYLLSQGPVDEDATDKCEDKEIQEGRKCWEKSDDEIDECIDKVIESTRKCLDRADGWYELKIKNNYIGDDGNKYDESSKDGTIDFNDPRLISVVAAACRDENSLVEITFKEGVIGIDN